MLAPLIGPLMENDQLAGVIRVLTISFLLTGLSTVQYISLRRGLRFKALGRNVFLYPGVRMRCSVCAQWSLVWSLVGCR